MALSSSALAGFLFFLGGCGTEATPVATEMTDDRIPVRTVAISRETSTLPIEASGIVTSTAEQRLSFKIGGIIRKIYVDEGDVVRPGQLLAVLDKTEIDAQVAQAQQALSKAERDLGRVEGLYRDSSATLELLQNATTGRDVAKETMRIASFNQQYAEIRATRGGKIIKKLANEGEVTGPGMPAFVLFETGSEDWVVKLNVSDPNDWVVLVAVSDRDWARLQVGMLAELALDAYPGQAITGRIRDLAPAADPSNGLYPVEVSIPSRNLRLAPGLFAKARIAPKDTRTYYALPLEAIVEGDDRSAYVFVPQTDGETVRKVQVHVAQITAKTALVDQGLEGVNAVVSSGAPYLSEKKKIKILN